MNQADPSPDEAGIRSTVEVLRTWESKVDALQAAKLAAARRRALAATEGRSRLADWASGWQGAAVAATLLISVGVGIWPHKKPTLSAPPMAMIDNPELLDGDNADNDELLDDDLEFSLALSGLDEAT